MSLRRRISEFFFDLAEHTDADYVIDRSCDLAMDMGFGYCDDCEGVFDDSRD